MPEVISVLEAAKIAHVSTVTIIKWISDFKIGRKFGGRWKVYKVGLDQMLNGDLFYSFTNRKNGMKVNKTFEFGANDGKKVG